MNIQAFSSRYQARTLSEQDIPMILSLCMGNPQYYRYCPPLATEESVRRDIKALPPGKTKEDKFYIGCFEGEHLIAVIDYIKHYPDSNTGFIGFFMTDAQKQGRGIGSQIIEEFCQLLAKEGISKIKLGWVKGNKQAERFWCKNHFVETGQTSEEELYTIIIAERKL